MKFPTAGERGGIITSLKLGGVELLYLDEETLENREVNVKGGVPILFPNAGPLESSKFPGLKQHGFARTSDRWQQEQGENDRGFVQMLRADETTRGIYPHDFRLSIEGLLEKDGSFTLLQEVANLDSDQEMPVAMGLHPYFRVPHALKKDIKFNFEGGKIIEKEVESWANGVAVSIDNSKVKDPQALMEVEIPFVGTLVFDISAEYKKIWVWSLPDKDFVCIEPVMRDAGGLVDDPEMVKPGATSTARMNVALKPSMSREDG